MELATDSFLFLRTLLQARSAMVLDDDKHYLVQARLGGVARAEGLASLDHLVRRLRIGDNTDLERKVVEAMTVNETSFFRDWNPFEALRQHILPPLLRQRTPRRTLTIWSAACSTGQEPYSVAILLREHFPELADWRVRILATDLSTEVLDQAKRGSYSQLEVNRGLPAKLLARYFTQQGKQWLVKPDLAAMVEFRQLNLVESWGALPQCDVVLLRNVLIYFDVARRKDILARLQQVLRPDGALLLGGAETTLLLDSSFESVHHGRAVWYRLRSAA